jgi:nucleotide-binding universal stress UspA family protein
MSFQKILCPIDFSAGSEQAMRAAARLAHEANAELALVHSWYVPPTAFAGEYMISPSLIQEMSDDAARGLEAAVREVTALGVPRVSSRLLTGLPWREIVDVLEQDHAYDLVVIGTHGRTGLARILLGSVAEQVIRHAPCSVLAVRPDGEPVPFKHALCPVDFSESSRHAAELAVELVHTGGVGITLLHVLELPVAFSGVPLSDDFVRDLDKHAAERLDDWVRTLAAKASVPLIARSRIGRPGAQTLAALDADPSFDLVVMGSYGRTGLRRMLLGSVAEQVVRHAKVPVLVARHRADTTA